MPIAANRLLIAAVIAAHGVHIAAMYTPGLSGVLAIEPVPASTWGMLLGVAISVLLLDEFAKHIHRKRAG
jgi:hypothetical protein